MQCLSLEDLSDYLIMSKRCSVCESMLAVVVKLGSAARRCAVILRIRAMQRRCAGGI